MKSTVVLVLCVSAVLALAAPAQAQTDVFAWMDKNAKAFKTLVNGLGITRKRLPANTKGTLLVPSDRAINAFVRQMSLSGKRFMSRKQLVDLLISYHFIPGYQAKSIEDVPGNPTLAVTADFNYVLRFYKGNGRVWVKDVQGNDVTINSKPIQFGQLSVIPMDKVLMSGGYFFNGLDALKQYPQWSEAFKLAEQAGWPISSNQSDLTMFVPNNGVLTAGARTAWAGLSKADQKKQLLYHFVRAVMAIPQQVKSGKLLTLLKGHYLKVEVTPAQAKDGVPKVKVTPEVGAPVSVEIFNIFAGRAILQGVDGSLKAKLPGSISTEAAPNANGRRSLLFGRGSGRYYSGGSGYNQAAVNSIAATNTASAIDAAASGYVPASAATAYGSYQAEAAAAYGNNCYNCYYGDRWRGH